MEQHKQKTRRGSEYDYAVYNEFPVTYTPIKAGEYHIYLFGPIEANEQFIGALEVFNAASELDVVHVHLSTPGGLIDATDTFLTAMHRCEGRVIVHATGGCHSCGSIILLNAPEFTLSENFNSLIHNGSGGAIGDLNKMAAAAKYTVEHMTKVLRNTYEGFLSPDELDAMIDGKDFWMDAEEFMSRHEQRQNYFKAVLAEAGVVPVGEEVEETAPAAPKKRSGKLKQ